ncbi:hypothetical protein ESY86_19970 [Subsaximicrobium wynnwilliamsii]|uniref:Lipoprotein n=1 Tax=Subsaximicrobium wynnwilliamsii TaxID=291179 RepID=A0A5C6ZC83_9FLAO|nr:hypothetical protein [Subsaximicrobium wynnwilliamsii]TXD80791.1 hypothetical protein ESY87_20140 [Subsaximicrobium wynnwilliamsii]TXD86529.1 hypothetical protein ESY86_19970 [Subsaximicrobium wynnwilliamsii]TXE00085.1 hypothetical protein ESY88_20080 [Subsaximicrobium wynnwilliamsii]
MKNLLLLLTITLTLSCCKKDDDQSENPIDQLPPATQTGEQTFGCLINGEAFVPPSFGSNSPSAFYQFVDGAYTLSIYGSISGGPNLKSINIGCLDMPLIQETNYTLRERITNNYFGNYNIGGGITYSGSSSTEYPGTLVITNFDPDNFIISGTFEFTVLDSDGGEINITNGRFDMNYTN